MTVQKIVEQPVPQNVKLHPAYTEFLVVRDLGDLVVRDLGPVDDRYTALPVDFHDAFAVKDDRRVLIDPDTKIIRVKRYRRDQAADTAALGEVLIDNDVFKNTQPR